MQYICFLKDIQGRRQRLPRKKALVGKTNSITLISTLVNLTWCPKIIENHHGETKKFMDSSGDFSFLYDHFHNECNFTNSFQNMVLTIDDDNDANRNEEEVHHIVLGNTRQLIEDHHAPPRRRRGNDLNMSNYDNEGPVIDLNHNRHRRRRPQGLNNSDSLHSLINSATSSGFNSLTLYYDDEYENDSSFIRRNAEASLYGASDQQFAPRPTMSSSGYESGRRRRHTDSFSFSSRLGVVGQVSEEANQDREINANFNISSFHSHEPVCESPAATSCQVSDHLQQDTSRQSQIDDHLNGISFNVTDSGNYVCSPQPSLPVRQTVRTTRDIEQTEDHLSNGGPTIVHLHDNTTRKEARSSSLETPAATGYDSQSTGISSSLSHLLPDTASKMEQNHFFSKNIDSAREREQLLGFNKLKNQEVEHCPAEQPFLSRCLSTPGAPGLKGV